MPVQRDSGGAMKLLVQLVPRRAALLLAACGCALAAAVRAEPVALGPTLSRIARTGEVRVGYIPTPGTFAFRNEAGDTVGYSIELCLKVVERIRRTLNRPDLRVQFRPLAAAERIPLLTRGVIDIECGGNTNTVARQRDVDFSYTFFTTGVRLLVRQPFTVARAADLWQRRVAATAGTTAHDIVMRLKTEQDLRPISVASDAEGVRLVATGQADAFAQDDVLLYGLLAASTRRGELAITGPFMTVEPYAFMLPKDDRAFRELVDLALLALMRSGELEACYRRWFDNDRMRMPMSVYMKENLRFPNKYGVP